MMADGKKVEIEATSMPCNDSLTKLCEKYDQETAEIEIDLDIHGKLIKLLRENRLSNEQQLSTMQRNAEQTKKELQLLDEKTNDLIQNTNSQSEKLEQLKNLQKGIMNSINDAQHCLLTAQNTARNDLEKLHLKERETQKFLESNLASPDFSGVTSKLQNCRKTFSSKVQESIAHLSSLKSIGKEADHLEDLEKVLEGLRMDVVNLEGQIGEMDAQCSVCHKKIHKLNAAKEEEKQRRIVISEKYKQHKKHVAELTLALNGRQNDKKMLSESMNTKEQELNKNKERLERKSADATAIQLEVDAIKEKLAKLEDIMKFEQEKHEQEVQKIKEAHEADVCASKSLLMALRERESALLMQIQKARDDLNKKSEWETHRKINEEMERSLEQLKQERAQLQRAFDEKESFRNAQQSKMEAIKSAFQENKLEAAKKREILMVEVKRMSEEILGLKHKIAEEERRLKAKRNTADKQLQIATTSKNINTLMHGVAEKDEKFLQEGREIARELPLKNREMTSQKPRNVEFDKKVEKSEQGVKEIKAEKSGNEENAVRKTDSRKLLSKKKSADAEKLNSTFVVSGVKKSFSTTKRNEGRGGTQMASTEREEPKLSQTIAKYDTSKLGLVKHDPPLSDTLTTGLGTSKTGRQARKKRIPGEGKTRGMAVGLFDSDASVSTIKPICASTPLLQKKDEPSSCNSATEGTLKRRGKPRGKKAGALAKNTKTAKKKDAYDLDSDFD